MSIKIPTASLLGMLTDLLATVDSNAEAATGGVLIGSAVGFDGAEPGRTTILAGTSTSDTEGVIGHCHEAAEGTLAPVLLPQAGIAAVLATFKALLKEEKKHRKEDLVTYLQVVSEDGMVHVVETDDGALFDVGAKRLQVRFPAMPLGKFPRSLWSTLGEVHLDDVRTAPDGRSVRNGPRRVFPLPALSAFSSVARRRGLPMEIYTPHPLSPWHVQVGLSYRGQVRAATDTDGIDAEYPDVDIHAPELPALVPNIAPVG